MQRRYDLRALSNGRSDALDRTRAYVANGKNAAPAGLQRVAALAAVPAGQDEAFASSAMPDPESQSVFGSAPMNKKRC